MKRITEVILMNLKLASQTITEPNEPVEKTTANQQEMIRVPIPKESRYLSVSFNQASQIILSIESDPAAAKTERYFAILRANDEVPERMLVRGQNIAAIAEYVGSVRPAFYAAPLFIYQVRPR